MKLPEPNPRRFSEAAAHGLRVFPVNVADGPSPVVWADYQAREPTAAELAAWDASGYNVGILCGAPSGVVVLAVENLLGRDLCQFQLPVTPCLNAGRTKHYYFKDPAVDVGRAVSIEGVRLTAFCGASAVVGAGSVAPDGTEYAWELSPADVPFAEMPPLLISELLDAGNFRFGQTKYLSRLTPQTAKRVWDYLTELCFHCISDIEFMGVGHSRDGLHWIAKEVSWAAAAIGADWHALSELIKRAALKWGLEPHETSDILERWGMDEFYHPNHPLAIAAHWVYDEQSQTFCRRNFDTDEESDGADNLALDYEEADYLLSYGLIDRINAREIGPD